MFQHSELPVHDYSALEHGPGPGAGWRGLGRCLELGLGGAVTSLSVRLL